MVRRSGRTNWVPDSDRDQAVFGAGPIHRQEPIQPARSELGQSFGEKVVIVDLSTIKAYILLEENLLWYRSHESEESCENHQDEWRHDKSLFSNSDLFVGMGRSFIDACLDRPYTRAVTTLG